MPQLFRLCKEDPGSQRGDNEWDLTMGVWFRCGKWRSGIDSDNWKDFFRLASQNFVYKHLACILLWLLVTSTVLCFRYFTPLEGVLWATGWEGSGCSGGLSPSWCELSGWGSVKSVERRPRSEQHRNISQLRKLRDILYRGRVCIIVNSIQNILYHRMQKYEQIQ